jgi:hypothetical protein
MAKPGKRERKLLKLLNAQRAERIKRAGKAVSGPQGYASVSGQVVPTITQSVKWGHDANTARSIFMRDGIKRGYVKLPTR